MIGIEWIPRRWACRGAWLWQVFFPGIWAPVFWNPATARGMESPMALLCWRRQIWTLAVLNVSQGESYTKCCCCYKLSAIADFLSSNRRAAKRCSVSTVHKSMTYSFSQEDPLFSPDMLAPESRAPSIAMDANIIQWHIHTYCSVDKYVKSHCKWDCAKIAASSRTGCITLRQHSSHASFITSLLFLLEWFRPILRLTLSAVLFFYLVLFDKCRYAWTEFSNDPPLTFWLAVPRPTFLASAGIDDKTTFAWTRGDPLLAPVLIYIRLLYLLLCS